MKEKEKGKNENKFRQESKILPSKCNIQIMVGENAASVIREEGNTVKKGVKRSQVLK